jgi:hypothetical protein
MPKPSDLFLNVLGFFAILVPGALLAYLGFDIVGGWLGGALPVVTGEVPRWIAFVVASFLLGQALYALGSWWLDPLYKARYVPYKTNKKGELLKNLTKRIEKLMGDDKAMTTVYPWARAYVTVRDASAAASIERLDADSKFFRAMTLVMVVAGFRFLGHGKWLLTVAIALAVGGSFLRFCHQRWERDETATELALALDTKSSLKT